MRMEYLPAGSPDCPLIRLYAFSADEAAWLSDLCAALASGETHTIALHEQPQIEPVAAMQLMLTRGDRDQGIQKTADPAAFQLVLTDEGWLDVAGRIAPFTHADERGGESFQWLDETGEVSLLLSPSGRW